MVDATKAALLKFAPLSGALDFVSSTSKVRWAPPGVKSGAGACSGEAQPCCAWTGAAEARLETRIAEKIGAIRSAVPTMTDGTLGGALAPSTAMGISPNPRSRKMPKHYEAMQDEANVQPLILLLFFLQLLPTPWS